MEKALEALLSGRVIGFRSEFADVAGGMAGGMFLTQAVYWQSKMGWGRWWYKTESDWWDECRLSRRNLAAAKKVLVKLGILETKLRGVPPTTHYRLDRNKLLEALSKLEFPNCTNVQIKTYERTNQNVQSYDITQESKQENKTGNNHPPEDVKIKTKKGLSGRSASAIIDKWNKQQTMQDLVSENLGVTPSTSKVSLFYRKALVAAQYPPCQQLPRKSEMKLMALAKQLGNDQWAHVIGSAVEYWGALSAYADHKGVEPTVQGLSAIGPERLLHFADGLDRFATAERKADAGDKRKPRKGGITRARVRRNGDGTE